MRNHEGRILPAPKSVNFTAAPPRNPVGKVLKKTTLREPYCTGREHKI